MHAAIRCNRGSLLIRMETLVKHLAPPRLLRDASTYKYPRLEGTLRRLEDDTRVVRGTRLTVNFEPALFAASDTCRGT